MIQKVVIGEVPLYTEVSSFHGVVIREVPLYTEVSLFQGVVIVEVPLYIHVLLYGFVLLSCCHKRFFDLCIIGNCWHTTNSLNEASECSAAGQLYLKPNVCRAWPPQFRVGQPVCPQAQLFPLHGFEA